jgi:hypothetical protein
MKTALRCSAVFLAVACRDGFAVWNPQAASGILVSGLCI